MTMAIVLAGETALLRPAGTLWLPEYSTLIVADLHLEKGSAYAVRGQLLPPYDTRDTLQKLLKEVREVSPQRLVLLGDSLHDGDAVNRVEPDDAQLIEQLAISLDLIWITGNHDPNGGAVFGGKSLERLTVGNLLLRHEPKLGKSWGEVAGHLHPCARVQGAGGSIRRRCFISDGRRLILPAFGSYTGGLNVLDKAFSTLFSSRPDVFLTGSKITCLRHGQLTNDRQIASQLPRAT